MSDNTSDDIGAEIMDACSTTPEQSLEDQIKEAPPAGSTSEVTLDNSGGGDSANKRESEDPNEDVEHQGQDESGEPQEEDEAVIVYSEKSVVSIKLEKHNNHKREDQVDEPGKSFKYSVFENSEEEERTSTVTEQRFRLPKYIQQQQQQLQQTPRTMESEMRSTESVFENRELIHKFHAKMYRLSKVFVYVHVLLTTCGAIGYSIISISATNEWRDGIETPGWHIPGGFTANVTMINSLAVAVNLNLCFAALLIIGFHKHNRTMIWMWYLGQLTVEIAVTATLIVSVFYDCKLAAVLSIPPFLYYVVALSSFRQILATVALNKTIKV